LKKITDENKTNTIVQKHKKKNRKKNRKHAKTRKNTQNTLITSVKT